jgi:hypothetical protein
MWKNIFISINLLKASNFFFSLTFGFLTCFVLWCPQPSLLFVKELMVSVSSVLGPTEGHKVQYLLVTWGRLKRFFSFFGLETPSSVI